MTSITSKLSAQIIHAKTIIENEFNLTQSLNLSFSLLGELAKDLAPEPYFEIYSQYITLFESLSKRISNLKKDISENILEDTFNSILSYRKIIPRFYNALIFTCAIDNEDQIDLLIKMLPAISNPLRSFMVRYTFISFFPKSSPNLNQFALSNFSEMIQSIELINFKSKIIPDAALQWLNSNISISLSAETFSQDFLNSYFDKASQIENETIKLSIILSLIQTLSYPNILISLPQFILLFQSLTINDNTNNAAILFCSLLKNPSDQFEFASKTPFSTFCSEKVVQCALSNSDIDIIKHCIIEWPNENILDIIYQSIGTKRMIELLPTSFKLPQTFLLKLIDDVDKEIDQKTVRKLILTIHSSHSSEIEDAIVRMIYRNSYDDATITYIFEPPFIEESSTHTESQNQTENALLSNPSSQDIQKEETRNQTEPTSQPNLTSQNLQQNQTENTLQSNPSSQDIQQEETRNQTENNSQPNLTSQDLQQNQTDNALQSNQHFEEIQQNEHSQDAQQNQHENTLQQNEAPNELDKQFQQTQSESQILKDLPQVNSVPNNHNLQTESDKDLQQNEYDKSMQKTKNILNINTNLDNESQLNEHSISSDKANESENISSSESIKRPSLKSQLLPNFIEMHEPFTFKTSHLFQLVIMAMAQSNVDFRTIYYYIKSSLSPNSSIDQNVSLCVLCSVWPLGHSDDFIDLLSRIKSVTQDDLCIICNAFERLKIDNKDIEYFTSQCKTKDALISLLRYYISISDVDAIEKTIIRIFEFDGDLIGVIERLKLYFEVLNIAAEIKSDICINSDIFQKIFEIILQIVQFTRRFPMFVIDSNNNTYERFLKCLRNYSTIAIFKEFHDKINLIIELYIQNQT